MASLVMSGLRAMDTSDSVQRLMRYSMSPRGVTEPETNESVDTVDDTSQSPQTSTHKHKHNLKATRPKQQPQRESLSRLRQRVLPVGSAATAGAAASIGAAGTSNGGQQHRRPLDHSPRTEAAIPVGTFRALQPGKPLPQPPRHSETVQVRQMFARLDAMLDDPANRFMPFPGKGAGQAAPRSSRQRRSSTPGSRATAAASPNTRRRTVTSRSVGGDDTGDESDDSGATGERDAAATPSTPRRRGRGRDGTTATPPASSSRAAALAASRRRQRKRQHQGQRSVSPRSTASSPRPGTADSASGARKKSPRAESALDRAVDAAMLAVSGTQVVYSWWLAVCYRVTPACLQQLGQLMGLSRAASPDTLAAANKAALEAERAADDAVAAVNSGAATASRTPQRPLTQQQQQGTVKGQAPVRTHSTSERMRCQSLTLVLPPRPCSQQRHGPCAVSPLAAPGTQAPGLCLQVRRLLQGGHRLATAAPAH